MQLKLDNSKIYAIALEGGGAKGSYEVGVWQALEEAGIRYNAVSGTSVGALNGAMMAMRDLPRAIACWEDIRLSQIMALDQETEQDLSRLMNGQLELEDLQELLPQAVDIIKDRGLDVAPLRAWVREITDVQAIKNSDVELFVSTVDLTDRRALEIKVNDLPEDEVCNMLLASAYHPSFRLEKLGGKLYADGGFVDTIPIHALVENGYKDIIAVRIPGHGIEKRFRLPEDVSITYIEPTLDLGFVLNFDARRPGATCASAIWTPSGCSTVFTAGNTTLTAASATGRPSPCCWTCCRHRRSGRSAITASGGCPASPAGWMWPR